MASNERRNGPAKNRTTRNDDPSHMPGSITRPLSYSLIADCLLALKERIGKEENQSTDLDDLTELLDIAVKEFTQATTARLPLIKSSAEHDITSVTGNSTTDCGDHCAPSTDTHGATDDSEKPPETVDQAIGRCQNAVNLDPLDFGEYFNLGYYLKIAGRYKEALDAFMSFCSFGNPNDSSDLPRLLQALKWLRYLDRKMEIFGHTRC